MSAAAASNQRRRTDNRDPLASSDDKVRALAAT
jgi:hypothetical protein